MESSSLVISMPSAESAFGRGFLPKEKDMEPPTSSLGSLGRTQAASIMSELREQKQSSLSLPLRSPGVSKDNKHSSPLVKTSQERLLLANRSVSAPNICKASSTSVTLTAPMIQRSETPHKTKVQLLATTASVFDEGRAPSQLPPTKPQRQYSDEQNVDRELETNSSVRASKLAKTGSGESSWAAAPQPLCLARDEKLTVCSSPKTSPPVNHSEIHYTMEQLIDKLENPVSDGDDSDRCALVEAWKQLRSMMKTQTSLASSQQAIMSCLWSASKDDQYHHDTDLLQQLLLTVLAMCSLCPLHPCRDGLIPLLRLLIDLVRVHFKRDHFKRDGHDEIDPKLFHEDCIRIAYAIISSTERTCAEQADQEFIVDYLTTQLKEGVKLAALPLAYLASAIPDLPSQLHLRVKLSELEQPLWQVLTGKRTHVSVLEAAVALLPLARSEGNLIPASKRPIEVHQVLALLGILEQLSASPEAECTTLTLLANHDWKRSTSLPPKNKNNIISASANNLSQQLRRHKDKQLIQISVLIVTRKLITAFANDDVTTTLCDVLFGNVYYVLSNIAMDERVFSECSKVVFHVLTVKTAREVLLNWHMVTFNKIMEGMSTLLGTCGIEIATVAVDFLVQVSAIPLVPEQSSIFRSCIEALDKVIPDLKPPLIRAILNCLETAVPFNLDGEIDEGIVDGTLTAYLLKLLREQDCSEVYVQQCCNVLALLYSHASPDTSVGNRWVKVQCGSDVTTIRCFAQEELDALLKVMTIYPKNQEIQQLCTFALSRYFQLLTAASSSPSGALFCYPSIIKRGIQFVQEGLMRDNSDGFTEVIKLLCALIPLVGKYVPHTYMGNLVDTLVFRATQHLHVHSIQNDVLASLRCLSTLGRVAQVVESEKALPYLMYCIGMGPGFTCHGASAILQDMIRCDHIAVGTGFLAIPSGPQILTDCVHRHADNLLVQDCLCAALEAVALAAKKCHLESRLEASNDGGLAYVTALTRALQLFPDSTSLARSSCRALIGFLPLIDENVLWREQKPLCASIGQSLEAVKGCVVAQEAVIDAWFHVCNESDAFRGKLLPYVPTLLSAMRKNDHNKRIAGRACQIIGLIAAYEGPTLPKKHPSCVKLIVHSLTIHSEVPSHVQKALRTLVVLAAICDLKMHDEGIENILLDATKLHSSNPTIIAQMLNVLNNMTVTNRCNFTKISAPTEEPISERAIRFIIWAMTEHEGVKNVQANACRLLRNSLISEDLNRPRESKIRRNGDHFIPLLVAAADQFPDTCAHRAHFVLLRL